MKHIAIFRLSAMGDVAMTVPVIQALIEQHPEVQVTIVSRPFFAPFFAHLPRVQFFAVDLQKRHKGFWGLYRLYKDLKALSIDAFADFHNVLRSKIVRTFFQISQIPTAYTDKGRKEKKELTRAENKIFKPLKPMVHRHAEALQKLGFPIDLSKKTPIHQIKVPKEVKLPPMDPSKKRIGIAPFAQYETKVYPMELMKRTIALLADHPNYQIFLFGGGEQEIKKLNVLQQNLDNVTVVAGKVTFSEELLLIQNLQLMLSMDSGNAHIAAMYHIPTVTLWGHTHPYAGFAPFGQPETNCILSDRKQYPCLPTSVYGNKKREGYENVMYTITPETIVFTIDALLNENQ